MLVTTGFDRITDRILAGARGKQGRAYYDAIDSASKAAVAEVRKRSRAIAAASPTCTTAPTSTWCASSSCATCAWSTRRRTPSAITAARSTTSSGRATAGDFTLLRAYVGKDGKPADYAADNVPYVPPAHLQVSTRNVKEGDFAMLAGYPGVTFRHRMASEFANQIDWQLPSRVALYQRHDRHDRGRRQQGRGGAQVSYASQVRSLKNTLKRAQGELDGLRRSDAAHGAARRRSGDATPGSTSSPTPPRPAPTSPPRRR